MARKSLQIAVIGGGPAGSFLAYQLASAGKEPVLFHNPTELEKPCGGGIPFRAVEKIPELAPLLIPAKEVYEVLFVTQNGKRIRFPIRKPITVVARKLFDSSLRALAAKAGVKIIQEHVQSIHAKNKGFRISTKGGEYDAAFLAGADGAAGRCRKMFVQKPGAFRLSFGCGYFLPLPAIEGEEEWRSKIFIKFWKGREGYFWSFPRSGHLSVGLGCFMGTEKGSTMLARVREFISRELSPSLLENARPYAGIIPTLNYLDMSASLLSGRNWALVGDAAGLTDPITGEGIYYALSSASLLAQALIDDDPSSYGLRCEKTLLQELKRAQRLSRSFYQLGNPERMLLLAHLLPPFKRLMRLGLSGSLSYGMVEKTVGSFLWLLRRIPI